MKLVLKKTGGSVWNLPFITMLLINLFNSAGQYMIGTSLPKYANHLGAGPVLVGLVSSIFSIAALMIRPITGSALDYFKKKTMLCISLGITAVMYFICAFSGNVRLLVATRFLDGLGASVKIPICLALATDFLPEDKVGSGIGIYSLAQAIASALGPGISLGIINRCGYRVSLLITFGVAAISLLLALTLSGERYARPQEPFRISLRSVYAKEALFPALIILTLSMPYACTMAYLSILGDLYGIAEIGLFFTVYSVTLFIARPICGKLLDKVEFIKILFPSLLSYAAAMVLIGRARTLSAFLVAAVFAAFGYGVAHPCLQSLCMKWVPPDRRGAGGNTYYIGVDIGHFVGAMLTGQLVSWLMSTRCEAQAYSDGFILQVIPIGISMCVALAAGKVRGKSEHACRAESIDQADS